MEAPKKLVIAVQLVDNCSINLAILHQDECLRAKQGHEIILHASSMIILKSNIFPELAYHSTNMMIFHLRGSQTSRDFSIINHTFDSFSERVSFLNDLTKCMIELKGLLHYIIEDSSFDEFILAAKSSQTKFWESDVKKDAYLPSKEEPQVEPQFTLIETYELHPCLYSILKRRTSEDCPMYYVSFSCWAEYADQEDDQAVDYDNRCKGAVLSILNKDFKTLEEARVGVLKAHEYFSNI